ncbi:MAG TPA: anaerobic ribonucleoside-triphosphate reductase [Candidatus Akkermansia intestinigallinarum]|uniref:Anaerobic ribonucleoside-triphosphate reductase n=1 Tax=Candidatus Akkermansia intestinigallinarum TaxID=2838431 RepID=A0A9D1VA60_9BACT|nr:anaerobic ribonucleoside-triphosphate reductase [Candidatus Akkermansia intestinigallinarum]
MKDIKPVIKSDEEILKEHAEERTRCTVYTRVMGYHRPVETFNAGKQGEFEERAHFEEPGHCCACDSILK